MHAKSAYSVLNRIHLKSVSRSVIIKMKIIKSGMKHIDALGKKKKNNPQKAGKRLNKC